MVQNAYSTTLSTTTILLVPNDEGRSGLIISNVDATNGIYVSSDPKLITTGASGFFIPPKLMVSMDAPGFDPHLRYYAVAAAGTPIASVLMGFGKV